MNTPTLYLAAQDMQQKISLCVDDETGELDMDKLAAIECAFQERAVAYIAVIKTTTHNVVALKAVRDEYDKAIQRSEANTARLKEALTGAMLSTKTGKIASSDGILSATLYLGRDESIELEDGAIFPPSLCNDPKPPSPSKTKIKAAILAGEAIAGARLVRKDRLSIK